MPGRDAAERAGKAAKNARRLRRDRERAVGLVGAVLVAIPLLFAAVWTRTEMSAELRTRDRLSAERDSLHHEVLRLSCRKSRLTGWDEVERRLERTGLRPPGRADVVWVRVDDPERRGG